MVVNHPICPRNRNILLPSIEKYFVPTGFHFNGDRSKMSDSIFLGTLVLYFGGNYTSTTGLTLK